ncbi:MAG: rhomboid family intramembrane serine protease [Pseudomonadota bacterium]
MNELLSTPATLVIIAVTIAVTIAAWSDRSLEDRLIFHVGPIRLKNEWHRLISSGFLHGGALHLFFNMYVLWGFGQYLERWLGLAGFVFVYFVALLGGSLWSLMENKDNIMYRALGASGAVSGIVIGFILFQPFATLSLFFAIPMPAVVFGFLYIAVSAYFSAQEGNFGNIGHDAHLGGALTGGAATVLVEPRAWTNFIQSLSAIFGI